MRLRQLGFLLLVALSSGDIIGRQNEGSETNLTNIVTSTTETLASQTTTGSIQQESTTELTTAFPDPTTVSTTPKPNPPNPSTGIWSVTEGNLTCILVKLTASLTIPYNTVSGEVLNASVILPSNATSNGSCSLDPKTQGITISWKVVDMLPHSTNHITLVFEKNVTGDGIEQFHAREVSVKIYQDPLNFVNTSSASYFEGKLANTSLFHTNVNSSYRCNAESVVPVPLEADGDVLALVHMKHLQLEAFRREGKGEKFSVAVECPADGMMTSDIVPIAVGCALAALVVVVLIAYLIGRRRARQRGYQSV